MPTTDCVSPRVLIVDPSEEARLVLCELLGRSGVVAEATESAGAACVALSHRGFQAVVVDCDAVAPAESHTLAREAARIGAPIVAAGTNRPASMGEDRVAFVRKPYHYRELVHKIWAALGASDPQARAAA